MRPIAMDQNSGVVIAIIGVAADMVAAVYDQDAFVPLRCNAFRQHAAGEAGADNQPIEHFKLPCAEAAVLFMACGAR